MTYSDDFSDEENLLGNDSNGSSFDDWNEDDGLEDFSDIGTDEEDDDIPGLDPDVEKEDVFENEEQD